MPPRPLTGQELLELRDALVGALASPNELKDFVLYAIGQNIDNFIDPGASKYRIRDLITYTDARGTTANLVAAALQISPKNDALRRVAEALGADDGAGQFERVVRRHLGFTDTTVFLNGLINSMNAVCRVEIDEEGVGTGFLVGPSQVITNHHVAFDPDELPASPAAMTFHFDYKMLEGRPTKGIVHKPVSSQMIIADSGRTDLDFTLIRLNARAGDETVGDLSGAQVRGWLKPQARQPVENDPLMIIQHPNTTPQKFALGTITPAPNTEPNRVCYNVNTDEGSSGSPCFTSDWTPVALHHWGGSDHNRGVLFSAILAYLNTKGVALGS